MCNKELEQNLIGKKIIVVESKINTLQFYSKTYNATTPRKSEKNKNLN